MSHVIYTTRQLVQIGHTRPVRACRPHDIDHTVKLRLSYPHDAHHINELSAMSVLLYLLASRMSVVSVRILVLES